MKAVQSMALFALLVVVMVLSTSVAEVTTITAFGAPVEAIGSNTIVAGCGTAGVGPGCYSAGTNTVNMFIPNY